MKPILIVSTLLAAAVHASPLLAAEHTHDSNHSSVTRPAANALADGVVKSVNAAAGTVTLTHGPLPNGMPAMTMAFRVKQPAWLGQLAPGQKIRFAVAEPGGVLTLTWFEVLP